MEAQSDEIYTKYQRVTNTWTADEGGIHAEQEVGW